MLKKEYYKHSYIIILNNFIYTYYLIYRAKNQRNPQVDSNISFDELNSDIFTTQPQLQSTIEDSDSDDIYISKSQSKDEYLIYLNEDCECKQVSILLFFYI